MRQRPSDAATGRFTSILTAVCEGNLSEVDYIYLKEENGNKSLASFAGYGDTEYLNFSSKDTNGMNRVALPAHSKETGAPIARIDAEFGGGGLKFAKEADANKASGLERRLYLSVGAKVMSIWNGCTAAGPLGDLGGTVHGIIYEKGTAPPSLPEAIPVAFPVGGYYRGGFWLDEADDVNTAEVRIVKSSPRRDYYETDYHGVPAGKQKACFRIQFPLWLAWSRTIHKSQGLSLDHVVGNIGNAEFSAGLSYVLLSRVELHGGIYLDPFPTYKRFMAIKDKIEAAMIRHNSSRLSRSSYPKN